MASLIRQTLGKEAYKRYWNRKPTQTRKVAPDADTANR